MSEGEAHAGEAPWRPEDGPGLERQHRRRARTLVVAMVVATVGLAAAALALVGSSPGGGSAGAGGRAPGFTLDRVDDPGVTVSLKDFARRPLVLNFWASWCVPCRKEMPAFQAASERLAGRVAFVGINHQDSRAGATELLRDTGVRYPTGYDPGGEVAAAYGLFGMPTTVFVSPSGRILERRVGEISPEELDRALARHFGV